MAFTPAGHTQQSSLGYFVTRDATSVRHEQPRSEQTKEMIEQAYDPLQKRPPRSTSAWQAMLLANTTDFRKDIENIEQEVNKLLDNSAAKSKSRSAGSMLRRAAADVASIPDKGNVKANTSKAVHLGKGPQPNKLQKKNSPFANVKLQDGYAPMQTFLNVQSTARRQKKIELLRQETSELIEVLQDALKQAGDNRKVGALKHDAAKIELESLRKQLPEAPDAAQKALKLSAEHCEELEGKIKKQEDRIKNDVKLGRNVAKLKEDLAKMKVQLEKQQELRKVALGLQALQEANPMISHLEKMKVSLDRLSANTAADLETELADLKEANATEVEASLTGLIGLEGYKDKDQLQAFVRDKLQKVITSEFDLKKHAMPAPMVVDIYIGALAKAWEMEGAESDLDESDLNELHGEAMQVVLSLPGGLLAAEQINGAEIPKELRSAFRVEALATTTMKRLEEAWDGDGDIEDTPRYSALSAADDAAKAIKKEGNYESRTDVERGCYNAVRNKFFTATENTDTAIDPKLIDVNQRLEKMLTEWITDTQKKGLRNPSKDKTPFSDKTLDLASKTSTLGYDVPARPMSRLDKNLRQAVQRLRDLVPQEALDVITEDPSSSKAVDNLQTAVSSIAPGSLSGDQALMLGGILLAGDKSKENKDVRPGHISLEADDAQALTHLVQNRLGRLLAADAKIDATSVNDFIKTHGEKVANPHNVIDLFDDIKEHIVIDDSQKSSADLGRELQTNISVMRAMTAVEEVKNIRSLDDLYDYLAPKVYQFELRGKLKTSEGGVMGGSTKAFTWPLSLDPGTISVVLPIRGEIKGSATRCAVFEIGFSTTGFEIFVGTEKRTMKGGGGGVGVRVGYESILSSGGGVDKTVTFERSDTNGVWLRLPRAGDDEATRDQALAVLQTLLGRDEKPRGNAPDTRIGKFMEDEEGVQVMPQLIGELLANHSNLSVSAVGTYREETVRNEIAPNVSALTLAGGTGDNASRIQILGAGSKSERRSKLYRQSDKSGWMEVTRSNALSGGNAWGQAGVVSVNGLFAMDPTAKSSESYGGLASGHRQFQESGVDTKLRYIVRDGETNAVDTRIDIEDVNIKNHVHRVNQNQRELVALGAEQLFKSAAEKPPVHEQMRVAKGWLYDILKQAEEKSEGNSRHVFSISNCLNPSPAAVMDGLAAKAELERLHGNAVQAKHTDEQRDVVLRSPDSFKPWKVTTSERTSENRQFGWTTGVTYAKLQKTEGQRGTSSYPA